MRVNLAKSITATILLIGLTSSAMAAAAPAGEGGGQGMAFPAAPWAARDTIMPGSSVLLAQTDTQAQGSAADEATPTIAYRFLATKNDNGGVLLEGYAPGPQSRDLLMGAAGAMAMDALQLAPGAPSDFLRAAKTGLATLMQMTTGRLVFGADGWTLTGTVADEDLKADLLAALAGSAVTAEWTVDITITSASVAEDEGMRPEDATAPDQAAEDRALMQVAEAEKDIQTAQPEDTSAQGETPKTAEPAMDAGESAPISTEIADRQTEPQTEPQPEPAAPVIAPDYAFTATRAGSGPIALSGMVPSPQALSYLGLVAGRVPTDALSVEAAAPEEFTEMARSGIRALKALSDGTLAYANGGWSFSGTALEPEERARATAQLTANPMTQAWAAGIVAPAPIEYCRAKLATFVESNTILFNAGSDHITKASLAAVDELAGYLAACPNVIVHVEGHTDSDGDEASNLALSVARAEAVLDALVERGVAENRLYAVGYGEGLPIASNATREGKRRNRRIAFTLLEEHE